MAGQGTMLVADGQDDMRTAVYWHCGVCKIQVVHGPEVTSCRCPRCRVYMQWSKDPIKDFKIVDDNGKEIN